MNEFDNPSQSPPPCQPELSNQDRARADVCDMLRLRALRRLFCAVPAGIGVSVGQVITEVNDYLCQILGYTRNELLGKGVEILYGAAEVSEDAHPQSIGQPLLESADTRWRRKDGTFIDVNVRVSPVDSADSTQGVVFAVMDHTKQKLVAQALIESERKEAEESLRSAHQRLLDTIELLPDATFIVDQDKRLIAWNRACEQLTGVKKEELLGQGNYAYAVPFRGERRPLLIDLLDLASSELEAGYKYVQRIGDRLYAEAFAPLLNQGQGAHLWAVSAPLFDRGGKRFGAIEVIHDITERKQAEEVLRKNEAVLASLFASNPAGMGLMVNRRLQKVNAALCAITGYSEAELLHSSVRMLYADDEEYERVGHKLYETGDRAVTRMTEARMARKDGQVIHVLLGVSPFDPADLSLGAAVTILDITDRKQAEKALRESEEQLRQTQKLEAIGTLAGGIAHDFNNILGAMISYTELARREVADKPQAQENLENVLKACNRAKDLVRQILSFSRQTKQERKPLALEWVVKEALKLLRSSLPATVEMTEHITKDLPQVLADPTQIHQIIMNLCTNAAYAMRGQMGHLDVSLESFQADDEFVRPHPELRPGLYVRLSVSDTGCGMDEATQKRIFEPFFTTRGPGEGTGLGLSVVHGIVKGHDGAIYVASQPDHGSTFFVFFPALAFEGDAAPAMPNELILGRQEQVLQSGESESIHRNRILLADDDELFRGGFARLLRSEGFDCDCAANGAQALELLRAAKYDAMISDIFMPGNVGLELIQSVPQIAAGLPVILITGRPGVETAMKAVNLAVAGYLMKPPDLAELRPLLDRAIAGYRVFRAIAENRERLENWMHHLRRIEQTLRDPAASEKAMPIAQYLQALSSNFISVLAHMEQTLEFLVRLKKSGAAFEEQELLSALQHTMDALEQTKQNFKSKRLARLRADLQRLLREHGSNR